MAGPLDGRVAALTQIGPAQCGGERVRHTGRPSRCSCYISSEPQRSRPNEQWVDRLSPMELPEKGKARAEERDVACGGGLPGGSASARSKAKKQARSKAWIRAT